MQRANHRTIDLDRIAREREACDLALAEIMNALNYNGSWGWNDWNQYVATGEWN